MKTMWTRIVILALIASVGFAVVSLAQTHTFAWDTMGYVYAGQRIADGEGPTYEDANNAEIAPYFAPFAFQIRRSDDGRMFLGYPPGFPMLLAAGIFLTGHSSAASYIVPFLATLSVLAVFGLGRVLGSDEKVGLWAAILLVLNPSFWQFGTDAWSEMPSLLMVTAGVLFFLLAQESGRNKRRVVILSILAGLALSFSFFVRYANVMILPAIAVYEIVANRTAIFRDRSRWPVYAIVLLGLLAMLAFNVQYYGGALTTSYSPVHGWYPQSPFSLSYALNPSFVGGQSLIGSLVTIWHSFPILIVLLPLGLYLLPRAKGLLTAIAPLSMMSVYFVYAFAPVDENSRFLLPAYPFITIALAQGLVWLGSKLPGVYWRWAAGTALVIFLGAIVLPGQFRELSDRNAAGQQQIENIEAITAGSDEDAVYISYALNDLLAYQGGRSVLNYRRIPPSDPEAGRYRWEVLEPCLAYIVGQLLEGEKKVYYVEAESPPLADVLTILRNNFDLDPVPGSPTVHQILQQEGSETSFSAAACTQS